MGFQAGSVWALLGGQFNPAGFVAFDSAMKKSAANMQATEAAIAGSAKRSSAAVGGLGAAAGTAAKGGVLALGAAVAGSVAAAARFEKQMSAVQAVTKASEADMKRMADAAKRLGAESGLGATKTAKAIEELAKGGLTTAQILSGGLKGAIDLALAGQMDLGQAAETTANALNLFGLKGTDASHVADALATAANKTTADVADFAMALTQGGGAAKAAGLSFDETITALEALALSGVKGSDAGTSLKAAFSQLVNPTKESAETMRKLGLEFFTAEGNIKPISALAGELRGSLKGLTNEQRLAALQTIAGTDGFRALLALYEQGPSKIQGLKQGLQEQGTAADVAADKSDNLAGAVKRIGAAIENIATDAGGPFLDPFKEGLDDASAAIEEFRQKAEDQGLGDAIADALGVDPGAFSAVTGAIGDLGGAIGGIQFDAVTNRFETLRGVVSGVVGTIGSLLRGDFAGAWDAASGAVSSFVGGAVGALAPVGDLIAAPIRKGIDVVLGLYSTLLDATASMVGKLAAVPILGDKFDGLADGLRLAADEVNNLRDRINGVPKSVPIEVDTRAEDALRVLRGIEDTKLQRKVVRVLGQDTDAKTKIQRLIALGIPAKQARVLAAVGDALAGINSVRGAMAALQSRQIAVTVTTFFKQVGSPFKKRAHGRGPGGAELALVGEGRVPREYVADPASGSVMRVDEPTFMNLPPGAFVIPTDPAMRGGSLGLFTDLARELGIPGFKRGRKPKKKSSKNGKGQRREYEVPERIALGGVPFEDVEADYKQARESYQAARKDVKQSEEALSDLRTRLRRAKTDSARRSARQAIRDEEKRLRGRRALLTKRERPFKRAEADWKAAKHTNDKALDLESEANLAGDAMSDAARRGDPGAHAVARGRRTTALKDLIGVLQQALRLANPKSAYARQLREKLSRLGGASAVAGGRPDGGEVLAAEQEDAPELASPFDDSGLTEQERAQLASLEAARSLAALTETLDDDKATAGQAAGFLERMLGAALADPARGGAPVIKQLADQLGNVRGELDALTTGRGTVENQDLQAQLDQANERARIATLENQANIAALAAFGSPGDIGTGRFGNARDAGAQIVINTLHPGDPRTLAAVGAAAAGGFDLQGTSPNPPLVTGY